MNQEKIGKFIAEKRKLKKMTQSELAVKLGVSDRTIGNWECGRNMPDLSLFEPICRELNITLNEFLSGEEIKENKDTKKFEDNLLNTVNYSNKTLKEKNNSMGLLLTILGIIISITSFSVFASESSWNSIYTIIGSLISLFGIWKLTSNFNRKKRIILNISYFFIYILVFTFIDFISVINIKQAPRFSYLKYYYNDIIEYKSLFCNVYRINHDTKNEYYIIDINKKYNIESIPNVPFNRTKSGIDNIIKYKNKYVGNNSNDGNLISNLPLAEYGYTFIIDSENLGLTINYHIESWYINDNLYLEKSLIYNSISLFSLIDNLNYIDYNFSGNSFKVNKTLIEKNYPHYGDINKNLIINKDNFNKYLENKINDDDFIKEIFSKVVEIK